jgi:hypothetical protein
MPKRERAEVVKDPLHGGNYNSAPLDNAIAHALEVHGIEDEVGLNKTDAYRSLYVRRSIVCSATSELMSS